MSRIHKYGKEPKPHRVQEYFWSKLQITGNITTISPAMWTLQHLTSLYLNDNCLSRIPAEISRLEHLMHLDLANNKILSLPAEIGELTRLRQLFLDNNQLRVLPYEIGKLCNLQYIGLQGNPLNFEIQAVYSESNGTRKLLSYMLNNLAGNITTISPAMWTLQHLTSLYLNDNCLSRIPAEISRLEHLMHLDLANNKILSLPAEIGELTRLRQLFLDNNQLRVLPYEIGKLCNLQYIGLQGNPLNFEIQAVYSESNGTRKLLSYMLNNLAGQLD
ncbi:hypothetical protein Pmani_008706 [Petrolisthes manimaculis]|uniref:Disease resistance R13L4/SHOC-2-like LRR domain-containing protein n=1 Tax=Petrolisthes manimaculis TaxID=1843537 RepID=A0AAE1UED5_9EUCA|nr:hypothetical protein Pmani_008706 [Petrolisthes manimaculis]